MPSGALGGAWRCVLRSNFSIQTWSSILPDAARVKDLRWTCVDGVLPSRDGAPAARGSRGSKRCHRSDGVGAKPPSRHAIEQKA